MRVAIEDGCLSVSDFDGYVSTTASTPLGIDNLKKLLADSNTDETPQ